MQAKGDIRANFEKLKTDLRSIKYLNPLEQGQILDGIPLGFLPVIHHALLVYSPLVAKFISEKGFELQAKSDYRFIENTYKILLTHFQGYKPQITIQQFFTNGFSECKIIMCIEVIGIIKDKHKELMSKTQNINLVNKLPSVNNNGVQQPRVIRHQPEENKNSIGGGSQFLQLPSNFDHVTSVQKLEQPEIELQSQKDVRFKRDRNETKELMELIMGLNQSVKSLAGRFESFSTQIEGKVNRLQSEMVLVKNKVEFIERNMTTNQSGSGVISSGTGNRDPSNASSQQYTQYTHPSSNFNNQRSGVSAISGAQGGAVGVPPEVEPPLLNFAHEQSMKSVQQLPDVDFTEKSTYSLNNNLTSIEELKQEYQQRQVNQETTNNSNQFGGATMAANPFQTGNPTALTGMRQEFQSVPSAANGPIGGQESTEELIARVQSRFQETKEMLNNQR